MYSSCHLSMREDLTNAINKFWQIEDCLSRENLTAEEEYTEECFKNNYVRNEEGRFVVKLPMNQKVISQLGDLRDIAMKRLLGVEWKFKKIPGLKTDYVNFMKEYLELGHLKLVTVSTSEKKRVFLPHQAVIKKDAIITKRVVFDVSSKDSRDFSLNNALCKGPLIQLDLFSIVIRFRCFKYVICVDIKKMCRQVMVYEDHTLLQTFFGAKIRKSKYKCLNSLQSRIE